MRVLFPLLTLVLLLACGSFSRQVSDEPIVLPASRVLEVPPSKMRVALREEYALRPDRRFLEALPAIARVMGNPAGTVDVTWHDGYWNILHDNQPVGSVDELADFDAMFDLLIEWAARQVADSAIRIGPHVPDSQVEGELKAFHAPVQLQLLETLGKRWTSEGTVNAYLLTASARAISHVLLQQVDLMGIGDALGAHAWGLLALAHTTGELDVASKCRVAWSLGYTRPARDCAADIDTERGLKAFLRHDRQGLREAALGADTPEAHYLYLRYVAERRDKDAWLAWWRDRHPNVSEELSLVSTGLHLRDFTRTTGLAQRLVADTCVTVAHTYGDAAGMGLFERWLLDEDTPPLMIRFIVLVSRGWITEPCEKRLLAAESEPVTLHSPAAASAFYRGYLYSALQEEARHHLDARSSSHSAGWLLESTRGTHGLMPEFADWYQALIDAKQGSDPTRPLLQNILAGELGPGAWWRTLAELETRLDAQDPRHPALLRLWFSRLDARPDHRAKLASRAWHTLQDLPLMERMYGTLVRDAGDAHHTEAIAWAAYSEDEPQLLALLSDPAFQDVRPQILERLRVASGQVTNPEIRQAYQQLMAAHPGRWHYVSAYIRYLERLEEYAQARNEARQWIYRYGPGEGLDGVFAAIAMARTYKKEKRYAEALPYVLEVVDSYQGGAMKLAADLLARLDRHAEAEDLYTRAHERYPDTGYIMAALVRFLWTLERDEEALSLASEWVRQYSPNDWREAMQAEFLAMANELPRGRVVSFYLSLARRVDLQLVAYFPAVLYPEHPDLTIELYQRTPAGGQARMAFTVYAYNYMQAAGKQDEAREWIEAQQLRLPIQASMFFYQMGAYEMLWQLFGADDPFLALLRSAPTLLAPPDHPRRQQAVDYYREPRDDKYFIIGRYLLDYESEASLWALANSHRERCEVAYYRGLKAMSEGQLTEASDWFRVAIETQSTRDAEHQWSRDQLRRWYNKGRPLDRIDLAASVATLGGGW